MKDLSSERYAVPSPPFSFICHNRLPTRVIVRILPLTRPSRINSSTQEAHTDKSTKLRTVRVSLFLFVCLQVCYAFVGMSVFRVGEGFVIWVKCSNAALGRCRSAIACSTIVDSRRSTKDISNHGHGAAHRGRYVFLLHHRITFLPLIIFTPRCRAGCRLPIMSYITSTVPSSFST